MKILHAAWLVTPLMFFANWALAQPLEPGWARVTTEVFNDISSSQPIAIEAETDSELTSRLAELIRRELKSRFAESDKGSTGLTLRFATVMFDEDEQRLRPRVELDGHAGNRGRSTITGVLTLPLAKKTQQQRDPGQGPRVGLHFDVLSSGGKIAWSGDIVAARGTNDRYAVLSRLVPLLLERLGKGTDDEIVPFEQ